MEPGLTIAVTLSCQLFKILVWGVVGSGPTDSMYSSGGQRVALGRVCFEICPWMKEGRDEAEMPGHSLEENII